MSDCLSPPVSLKFTSKSQQHKSQDKILAKRIVWIAARIFGLGKKTENTQNEKSTNPLIINPLLHKQTSEIRQAAKTSNSRIKWWRWGWWWWRSGRRGGKRQEKRKKKTTKETEVVHSPSCFQKPTPTNAKQKAKLIELKQTLNNPTLATATTNLRKRIRRRSFWFGFFWVGSKTLTCVVSFESLDTWLYYFQQCWKFQRNIFGDKFSIFCQGKQGIF